MYYYYVHDLIGVSLVSLYVHHGNMILGFLILMLVCIFLLKFFLGSV